MIIISLPSKRAAIEVLFETYFSLIADPRVLDAATYSRPDEITVAAAADPTARALPVSSMLRPIVSLGLSASRTFSHTLAGLLQPADFSAGQCHGLEDPFEPETGFVVRLFPRAGFGFNIPILAGSVVLVHRGPSLQLKGFGFK
jgi:hypothetical protein